MKNIHTVTKYKGNLSTLFGLRPREYWRQWRAIVFHRGNCYTKNIKPVPVSLNLLTVILYGVIALRSIIIMVGLVYLCLFYLLNQIYLLVLWPHKELALASWTVVSPQIEHKMIQNYTTFWSTAIAGSEIRSFGLKIGCSSFYLPWLNNFSEFPQNWATWEKMSKQYPQPKKTFAVIPLQSYEITASPQEREIIISKMSTNIHSYWLAKSKIKVSPKVCLVSEKI